MGRSRGGLTTKIHALVDANGLPITLKLTEGQAHDGRSAVDMLGGLQTGKILLVDRAYDSHALREAMAAQGAWGAWANSGRHPAGSTRRHLVRSCIATGIWSNASSTNSSTIEPSPPDTCSGAQSKCGRRAIKGGFQRTIRENIGRRGRTLSETRRTIAETDARSSVPTQIS